MLVRKTFWGAFVVLLGSILGVLMTGAGIYYRLIYITLLLIILSWVWARVSIANVKVDRVSRGLRQQLGHVFEQQFTVLNNFPLTKPWIEVEDGSGLTSSGSSRVLTWVKASSVRNYSGYTLLSKRGEYFLSPTILYSGDPFGLFAFRKVIPTKERLLVLPFLVDFDKFPLPSGRLPGGIAVRRRTPEVEPPRAAGVREYAPGDSLNRIHWPTTAKRDRWMVKEFEQDPQADIWILLDANTASHAFQEDDQVHDLEQIPLWWLNRSEFTLPADTFEYATSIAGSVAKYFSRGGQVVGFASAAKQRVILSSERGERQLNKILETLAILKPDGTVPLVSLVDSQAAFLPKGSTVIMITSSTHESIISGLASLLRRGLNPMMILIDPSSFGKYYGVDRIVSSLQKWRVPYTIIRLGENIKHAIENGFKNIRI